MATDIRLKESLPALVERIVGTYEECGPLNHLGASPLPSYREVVEILIDLREILYPGYGRRQNLHMGNVAYHVGDLIDSLYGRLSEQIARAYRH
ncbi:MAG TPA: serine acetyltransferase, partial [Isosphaeraceae bacterium]